MGIIERVDWPEPLTIPDQARELKKELLDLLSSDDDERNERRLDYIVAVSSGKAVTEEIPKQIGRRAGWASQQGANFVEIIIENPAQLIMDQEMLINLADRLNLHYNIHSSTSLAYGTSYRVGRGNGYDPAHEYTIKLLKETRRFRAELRRQGLDPAEDGLPRLYAINPHMAISQVPPEEERLAQDVSVDPWGEEMEESRIFKNREARIGIWRYYLWDYLGIGSDVNEFAQILGNIEEVQDAQEYINENLIDLLADRGYLSDDLLSFIHRVTTEQDLQPVMEQLNLSRFRQFEVPESLDQLKNHVNARDLAQRLSVASPSLEFDALPDEIQTTETDPETGQPIRTTVSKGEWLSDFGVSLPNTRSLDLADPEWRNLNEQAQKSILNTESDAYQDVENFLGTADGEQESDRAPYQVMQNIVDLRRYSDEFNQESTIFRRILPLWMPFADKDPIRELWEGITGQEFDSPDAAIDWLHRGPDAAMDNPRKEEDVIAAATGAYVWGHFTQTPPGYDKTLVEYLEDAEVYMSFESHFAGSAENTRIWKPKDMIEVVKAINSTPVETADGEVRTFDRTRVTIDMEHLATQKVNPMWVIDPPEEIQEKEGYKGLDEGDGELILMQHVTHPYIGEQDPGHFHGPVRRGDTLVYRYIHTLVEKGMATTGEDLPGVFMYEQGGEKDETIYLLRLILQMIEYGIHPDELESGGEHDVMNILNKDQPENVREYMIQKFFGVTDTEVQHEWQEIFEHALDPLEDLLQTTQGGHTWMGRAALEAENQPEDWQKEEWQ